MLQEGEHFEMYCDFYKAHYVDGPEIILEMKQRNDGFSA